MAEQIDAVRNDENSTTIEKARAIGYLAGVTLRAVELTNLVGRIEALEGRDRETCDDKEETR
ncbi:MAG: hypothetical protein AAF605_08365 [Myxococcota bacterium]